MTKYYLPILTFVLIQSRYLSVARLRLADEVIRGRRSLFYEGEGSDGCREVTGIRVNGRGREDI